MYKNLNSSNYFKREKNLVGAGAGAGTAFIIKIRNKK